MADSKRFPIMESPGGGLRSIPWALIAPQEQQAEDNHSQTLKRLAERGGLCPTEAIAVLRGVSYQQVRGMTEKSAVEELMFRVARFEAAQAVSEEVLAMAKSAAKWEMLDELTAAVKRHHDAMQDIGRAYVAAWNELRAKYAPKGPSDGG